MPEDPTWTNLAPSAVVTASSQLTAMLPPAGRPAPDFFFGSLPFRAVNVVDRKLDPSRSEWAAEPEPGKEQSVRLDWTTNLSAREVVIYGTAQTTEGMVAPHQQTINGLTLVTRRGGEVQQSVAVRRDILPGGTRVELDPGVEFDSLEVSIQPQDVTGLYELPGSIALAEIEVIARATGLPRTSFRRGDVDCSAVVDLTDVIFMLNHLFLGGPPPCCGDAFDVNSDRVRDMSDPIFLLSFMFLGVARPEAPFPACEASEDAGGDCAKTVCF